MPHCACALQGVRCEKASCDGVLLAPQPQAAANANAANGNGSAPAPEEWICCECGRTKPARTPQGGGCQDVVDAAHQSWQLVMALSQAGVRLLSLWTASKQNCKLRGGGRRAAQLAAGDGAVPGRGAAPFRTLSNSCSFH